MNHTAIAANLSQYQEDRQFLQASFPNVTYVLGETNSDYINLNMAQIEGVFGSALWFVDYLLYGMTQVRFRGLSEGLLIMNTRKERD